MVGRPDENEYAEFYGGYISLVGETDIVSALEQQFDVVRNVFSRVSEDRELFAYAPGKWTIRENLGHLIDGERVFSYRAFRISRNDKTPLPGFDQNPYVENGNSNSIPLTELLHEFSLVREATCILFKNLSVEAWNRTGTVNDAVVSVRALAHMMVGHVRHHLKNLEERYLI